MVVVSIEDLDLFLALRKEDPLLEKEIKEVVEVEQLLKLAEDYGFDVTEADLFAAQQRDEGSMSCQVWQRRMTGDAGRVRLFIQG